MMTVDKDKNREQMQFFSMDQLVPKDHLLRLIDGAVDWSFIYDLVKEKYSEDQGRPSLDPVVLIKIPLIQYLYGIKSMRQTIRDIEVNMAYRWFLGLGIYDPVPHFTTFGKNYTRRFKDTDLFEQIFSHVLEECISHKFVDTSTVFIDATHIKACANNKKFINRAAKEEAMFYEAKLNAEIDKEREESGKKPLKKKEDDDDDGGPKGPEAPGGGEGRTVKESTTDPESGWFHKGEHKQVFAYTAETACDEHGWILGYTVHPGNEHDSRTFPDIYKKVKGLNPECIVADAGYKTPPIAKMLLDDGIKPVFPYKRPMTAKGFFRKYEYAYDEYFDCYVCPNDKTLEFSTVDREGYREYKSNPRECEACSFLEQCTHSASHVKVINRHVWEDYMEQCEEIRQTLGMKAVYEKRKETIERIFGTAKEFHQMRYTNMIGAARMRMKVGLTYTCMNLKKLAMMIKKYGPKNGPLHFFSKLVIFFSVKENRALGIC
jgi:transposase